jgi:hypothetical protein
MKKQKEPAENATYSIIDAETVEFKAPDRPIALRVRSHERLQICERSKDRPRINRDLLTADRSSSLRAILRTDPSWLDG